MQRVVALSGGVGGAKLALGLYRVLPPGTLTVLVNTGDDFEHLGLRICPDLDTTLYTLAGLADPERGWGRKDETWNFMETLAVVGGDTWFRLGDRDLALHLERTCRLAEGASLSAVIEEVSPRLGICATVVPVTDDPVRTEVETEDGVLPFQEYFVRRRCEPRVLKFHYAGAARARLSPGARRALADGPDLIVICPSNPFLSIDPQLAIPALRPALRASGAPVIAVTPIIGGEAVKGPTAKIMRELGLALTPAVIARHYADVINGFVADARDEGGGVEFGCAVTFTNTLMRSLEDRECLARAVLAFAAAAALRRSARA